MKRLPEAALIGVTAATLMVGCTSSHQETAKSPASSEAPASTSEAPKVDPKVQQLAGNVIKITQMYPGADAGKPPRSIGVTVPYPKGGQLDVFVQTASESTPDANRPQEIGLMQTSAGGNTFSVQFLVRDNGNVDVTCTDHLGIVTAEEDEQKVVYGTSSQPAARTTESPALARTILNSAVESALMVTQYAADGNPQQIGDMCHVVGQ